MFDRNATSPEDRDLSKAQKSAEKELKSSVKERVTASLRFGEEQERFLIEKVEHLYGAKSEEMKQFMLEARAMRFEQEGEVLNKTWVHLQSVYAAALSKLVQRVDLMLELSGGEDKVINSAQELLHFDELNYPTLENLDVYKLLQESDESGILTSYIEAMRPVHEGIPPSYFELLAKIEADKEALTPEDYEYIAREMYTLKELEKGQLMSVRQIMASTLLASLDQAERLQLVESVWDDPDTPALLLNMVQGNYLTTQQALHLLEKNGITESADPEKRRKKLRKKRKGHLEARYAEVRLLILDERMQAVQSKTLEKQEKDAQRLKGQFGHRRILHKWISLEGMASLALVANGSVTTFVNTVRYIKQPGEALINPGTWAGVGMVAAGLELSDGFGGMVPKTSEVLGRALDKTPEESHPMDGTLSRSPYHSALYYNLADRIVGVYKDKKRETGRSDVSISFEELDMNYDALPDKYRLYSKESYEGFFAQVVREFTHPDFGLTRMSGSAQQRYMEESLERQNIKTGYETISFNTE